MFNKSAGVDRSAGADCARCDVGLENGFVAVANGDVVAGIHDNAVALHELYAVKVDDVGPMDLKEIVGECFYDGGEGAECDEGCRFVVDVNLEIFAIAFDEAYGGEGKTNVSIVDFDKERFGL